MLKVPFEELPSKTQDIWERYKSDLMLEIELLPSTDPADAHLYNLICNRECIRRAQQHFLYVFFFLFLGTDHCIFSLE